MAEGWRIVAADRDAGALATLEGRGAANLRTVDRDVTDEAAVERAVGEIDETFGPPRGVVNSAGIGREVPFLETAPELFRLIYEINGVGSFIVSRAAQGASRAPS
ncbi:SDR family oxidoreductase [Chelatococcus sp. SYSU_G07232]|uniref:SDR family oxidoreductase n=1 Tax=Chelatococcus albus TaxID=3047466 RepID=A0ABT7ALD6_9HYPH|nr:SDR family oxidoreductase [Chelatococcus sp. SYSU_G07232]MDJ1159880.1 SDR family oxidoreductase [Chelatococcus sp. SYSU_G07232]